MGDKNIQKKSSKTVKKDTKKKDDKTKKDEAIQKAKETKEDTTSKGSHASRIARCDCVHPYQDDRYGMNMRVHTPKKTGGWRCTVCSKEH